jgi:hypothetical protein
MIRFPLVAALVVLLSLVLGCAGPAPRYRFLEDPAQEIHDLETTLSIDPVELAPGDTAHLVLTLSNTGTSRFQLSFPSRRQVGLAVYEENGELYFTDVETLRLPRMVPLRTLQSWSREIEWDGAVGIDGRRDPLPPGKYEVQVGLRREGDAFTNRTNRVAIEILEEAKP